jgi:hypothetical protein
LTAGGQACIGCVHAPGGKKNVWGRLLAQPAWVWPGGLVGQLAFSQTDIFIASQGAFFIQQGQTEPVKAERSEPFGLDLDRLRRPCYFPF